MSQRGKFFFAFLSVSEHFELIETNSFFFFLNFREREAQNVRERSEQDASVLDVLELRSDRLYQSFLKDHSQLSYCSLEIMIAVKDCDPCGALLFSFYLGHICLETARNSKGVGPEISLYQLL